MTIAASSFSSRSLVPGRALRDHEVADVGGRVDHAHLDLPRRARARTPRGLPGGPRPHASDRAGSCTSPAAARAAPSDSTSTACTRPCGARRRVLEGDHLRRLPGSRPSSRAAARASSSSALLEGRIDPRAGDEPRAVGGRARHEPVDPCAHLLVRETPFSTSRSSSARTRAAPPARRRGRSDRAGDRGRGRSRASSQCSNRSAKTRSRLAGSRATRSVSRTRRGRAAAGVPIIAVRPCLGVRERA